MSKNKTKSATPPRAEFQAWEATVLSNIATETAAIKGLEKMISAMQEQKRCRRRLVCCMKNSLKLGRDQEKRYQ